MVWRRGAGVLRVRNVGLAAGGLKGGGVEISPGGRGGQNNVWANNEISACVSGVGKRGRYAPP